MGWRPTIRVVERRGDTVHFVVRTGTQTNCAGIAQITVRGERAPSECTVRDAVAGEETLVFREAAMRAMESGLHEERAVRVTLEDAYDHPVDLSTAKFAEAGRAAAAFLRAWLREPEASDEELVTKAWETSRE